MEKLYSGELTGHSEVAPLGDSRFRRIAELEIFKVHLAKAEAKLRVEAQAKQQQAKARRGRNAVIGVVAVAALVVAGGAAVAARYFAVHNPFRSAEDDSDGISIEPPKIALARAHPRDDDELIAYSGAKRQDPAPGKPPPALASRSPAGQKTGPGAVQEEADGLQTAQFDQGAINSVVNGNQRKLFVCFREESQRNPGFAAKIPLEFVIGNNGRVSKLWVDHPSYKTGPMADCLLRELQKWPFKAYEGEQATVSLSFTIGAPKT